MRKTRLAAGVLVAVAVAAAALLVRGYLQPTDDAAAQRRPAFALPDLDGETRHISEWDGQTLLVNFWATWCAPCRREIPLLIDTQRRYGDAAGLQVLGIAVDSAEKARPFAREMGINYPVLVSGPQGIELSKAFGDDVGALPFSVLVGPDGRIQDSHAGELHETQLRAMLREHLDGAINHSD